MKDIGERKRERKNERRNDNFCFEIKKRKRKILKNSKKNLRKRRYKGMEKNVHTRVGVGEGVYKSSTGVQHEPKKHIEIVERNGKGI